jgi:hypothetical protein
MNISPAFLLATIALYGLCVAVAVGMILRLRDRARNRGALGMSLVLAVFRDVVVLAALPILASIAAFFLPSFAYPFFGGADPAGLREIGAFAVAQGVWSVPSACFYVLGTRLLRERFSLRKVVVYTLASLAVLGVASVESRSALPPFAAGVIAQVVGGVLPLSAVSALPPQVAISVDGSATTMDWDSISIVRTGWLCAALVLGYLFLKPRLAAPDERS